MAYGSNFNVFCQYCLNVRNLYACETLADIKSEGVDGWRVNSPATGTNKTIKAATIIMKLRELGLLQVESSQVATFSPVLFFCFFVFFSFFLSDSA